MRKNFTIFMITLFIALLSGTASAQRFAVKSNLLYDITSTINLGVEYKVAPRWTLEMSANYNPWSFSDNKKMKLWMLQPEARYWLCSGFSGHFFGAHLLGGEFNYGGMLPFGITPSSSGLGSKRYQGWMAGAGIGYGYNWALGKRWNLEATLGVGYIHFGYDRFECKTCGDELELPGPHQGRHLPYLYNKVTDREAEDYEILCAIMWTAADAGSRFIG